ncbi:ATP-dependent Clp protease proteolytic subunit [Fusobacterium sp. DD29]|uniref:head maturation protease, ClpP-related n=1 Tax=unclassified Fusobacterium TaxID=2648384 RepID=UPI001B8D7FF6|nr:MULTISPECIES: head maturation protease, ClpP-related [unclassified Fusobacterium]MBR8701151.1 ATP-dependent Clp protease proteolytic subunit [Fusobacterium sp. DD45]MBR8711336.1 ATP-dependent Clp protease proteolytic subunit [Fusobacterium sp. DD28]MBR8750167.1 ATP-dependent Clp protease proteolytic subunit [Fusobacterium sp. DD29]MBR8751885.1 ATP-dependent Clp protease proteolytic subunit [Fusobacterium sp. DD26]MBR8762409.1 ATP-dependent Clp protease proteolytic subunit [Fusobacterium sp.
MSKKFFEIRNISENTGEITIYGEIYKYAYEEFGDVSSLSFSKELEKLKDKTKINIKINSGGGDVFEALAIHHQLKRLGENKEVTAYIDGLAASAATLIALGANKIIMGKGCYFMIHNPSSFMGYATIEELEQMKEHLEKTKQNIIDLYLEKTNLSRDELVEKMDNETWFTSDEALKYGFVDSIATYGTNTLNNISNVLIPNISNKIPSELTQLINKNKEEKNMTLKELQEKYPNVYAEVKNNITQDLAKTDTVKKAIQNAVEAERARIKNLDGIKIYSEKAKEIVNKAKYEEVRDYKDVIVDLYNLNAEKAANEINQAEREKEQAGINNIASGHLGTPEEQEELNIINAALAELGIKGE